MAAIKISDDGGVVAEGNDLRGNEGGAWDVDESSKAMSRRRTIRRRRSRRRNRRSYSR